LETGINGLHAPRELTWVTGVLLLGVFLAFGFSGYLLPWNELAFFATRVGTAIVGAVPVIGHELLLLARGGEDVTGDTLARFYSLHVIVLLLIAFGLLGIHLFLVQQHGLSVPLQEGDPRGCGRCRPISNTCGVTPLPRAPTRKRSIGRASSGRRLRASSEGEHPWIDEGVATCVDCHGKHGILAVKDSTSPVYPTLVARTCASAIPTSSGWRGVFTMTGRWARSVRSMVSRCARAALLEKGDLAAPACNDCHGNHGAMPPGVDSVANACGTCHGKIANLFAETSMKHKFQRWGCPAVPPATARTIRLTPATRRSAWPTTSSTHSGRVPHGR